MKRFIISIPIVIAVVMLVNYLQEITYSNYKRGISVNILDTTGGLVCDATLDNPGTYVSDDGWAYFIITARNYDGDNNISDVPAAYSLDITNATGSNALYRVSTGNEVGLFSSSVTTNTYQFVGGTQQTKDFIVEVKTEGQDAEDVNFNISLNCYQITN